MSSALAAGSDAGAGGAESAAASCETGLASRSPLSSPSEAALALPRLLSAACRGLERRRDFGRRNCRNSVRLM